MLKEEGGGPHPDKNPRSPLKSTTNTVVLEEGHTRPL